MAVGSLLLTALKGMAAGSLAGGGGGAARYDPPLAKGAGGFARCFPPPRVQSGRRSCRRAGADQGQGGEGRGREGEGWGC